MSKRKKATLVEILEVLRLDLDDSRLDQLFDKLVVGEHAATRPQLKEAIEAFAQLFDAEKGTELKRRFAGNSVLISWRPAWVRGPPVPLVKVRLDRYVKQLDISAPDTVAANGRKYSEHRLLIEELQDRIIIHTGALATDANAVVIESDDG